MSGMGRRGFVALVGGAAAGWPVTARAQQRSKIPRIGYLDPLSRSSRMAAGWVEAFRSGLHNLSALVTDCAMEAWYHLSIA